MSRDVSIFITAIVGLLVTATATGAAPNTAGTATVTVCPSGCDFTSIQDAINGSAAPATINVQAGTYYENKIETNGLPYTIVGETTSDGTLLTIISGEGLDVDDDSSIFRFKYGETADTVLQDLVITGGTCKVQSGGVWIKDCSPTL